MAEKALAEEPFPRLTGQDAFSAALLDPTTTIPDGLVTPEGKPATRRFGIYRNNVAVSLVNALSEVFPTVQNLVGEEFFRAMAHEYVRAHPPQSRLLFEYGATFPAFLDGFEPAAELPFLADVARVERLWLDSFHAADVKPLDSGALARFPAERLSELRLAPHPATRLFAGAHAAVSIVSRDRSRLPLDEVDPFEAESGLITRPAFDPELRHLPVGGLDFVATLLTGGTLGEAAGAALATDEHFNLPAAISAILEAGAFTTASIEGEDA
jgi:hypothetical protein